MIEDVSPSAIVTTLYTLNSSSTSWAQGFIEGRTSYYVYRDALRAFKPGTGDYLIHERSITITEVTST